VFEFRNGDVGASEASKHIAEAFSALKSVGVDISADDEVVAKAAELDAETVKQGLPASSKRGYQPSTTSPSSQSPRCMSSPRWP